MVVVAVVTTGFKLWSKHKEKQTVLTGSVVLPVYDDSAFNTRAPENVRIKVEVLNATTERGLARRATQYLRDRGFDVVAMGNSSEKIDSTIVLDRIGNAEHAAIVAKAMHGRVEARPDTSRYLDVTVLVGKDWAPPPLPFYP